MRSKGLKFKAWHLDLLVWVLTITALIACAVLEYLTGYRAGVMHHLYYRKFQYLDGIFSSQMLTVYSAAVVTLMLFTLYQVLIKRNKAGHFISFLILPIAFLIAAYLPYFQELLIYPYILFTLLFSLVGFITTASLSKVFKLRAICS